MAFPPRAPSPRFSAITRRLSTLPEPPEDEGADQEAAEDAATPAKKKAAKPRPTPIAMPPMGGTSGY